MRVNLSYLLTHRNSSWEPDLCWDIVCLRNIISVFKRAVTIGTGIQVCISTWLFINWGNWEVGLLPSLPEGGIQANYWEN